MSKYVDNLLSLLRAAKLLPEDYYSDIYSKFLEHVCIPIKDSPGAAYLKRFGIDPDVADSYGVRYCHDLSLLRYVGDGDTLTDAGLYSLFLYQKAYIPFLVFPYIQNGNPRMLKSRCLFSQPDARELDIPLYLITRDAIPCLWNHDVISEVNKIIICQDEIDALSAITAGLDAVSVSGWSHWNDGWTAEFKEKDVVLIGNYENDEQVNIADISNRFIEAGLDHPKLIEIPKGKCFHDYIQEIINE